MGLFSKEEVVVLKESSEAEVYLQQLEELYPKAKGQIATEIKKEISITKAGIYGEKNILFELKNSGMDMVVLHDLYLKSKDGLSAQIDFLVLTPKLNFVIESKNLFGNIEINNRGDFIRTAIFGNDKYREGIYSPITQNQRHLQVIKECKNEEKNILMRAIGERYFSDFFKSLVVLANPKTIVDDRFAPKEIKQQVIRADQLISVIRQMNRESKESGISMKELRKKGEYWLGRCETSTNNSIEKFHKMILENQNVENINKEAIYIENDDTIKRKTGESIQYKKCPKCGRKMIIREAKKGSYAGQNFWGCLGYPKCKYTEKL